MKTSFDYLIGDVAKKLDIPLLNTRPKMFAFLRKYGIIQGLFPIPELISKGLFNVETRIFNCGGFPKTTYTIRVSRKGITFIKNLAKLIYE